MKFTKTSTTRKSDVIKKLFKEAAEAAKDGAMTAANAVGQKVGEVVGSTGGEIIRKVATESVRQYVPGGSILLGREKILAAKEEVSSFENRTINKEAQTYIVIHGFNNSANESWVKEMQAGIAKKDTSANVLALDWLAKGALLADYDAAADIKTQISGKFLADYIKAQGLDPSKVTLIGHSLGAHVSAATSESYAKMTGEKLDKIFALDPAGPNFEGGKGLTKDSATTVVAIHTNKTTFGMNRTAGTTDFYVTDRPTNTDAVKDHSHGHEVFIDLLKGKGFKQSDGKIVDLEFVNNPNNKGVVKIETNKGTVDIQTNKGTVEVTSTSTSGLYNDRENVGNNDDGLVSDYLVSQTSDLDRVDTLFNSNPQSEPLLGGGNDPILYGGKGNDAFRNSESDDSFLLSGGSFLGSHPKNYLEPRDFDFSANRNNLSDEITSGQHSFGTANNSQSRNPITSTEYGVVPLHLGNGDDSTNAIERNITATV